MIRTTSEKSAGRCHRRHSVLFMSVLNVIQNFCYCSFTVNFEHGFDPLDGTKNMVSPEVTVWKYFIIIIFWKTSQNKQENYKLNE